MSTRVEQSPEFTSKGERTLGQVACRDTPCSPFDQMAAKLGARTLGKLDQSQLIL